MIIKRRSLLAGFAAVAVTGIVAGCGGGSDDSSLPPDESDAVTAVAPSWRAFSIA